MFASLQLKCFYGFIRKFGIVILILHIKHTGTGDKGVDDLWSQSKDQNNLKTARGAGKTLYIAAGDEVSFSQ